MKEIAREIYPVLLAEFARPEITILVGARQVGKTHLLKKLHAHAEREKMRALYLDLEQPATLMRINRGEIEIMKLLTEGVDVLFIDEFYYMKDASHIFKAIFDGGKKVKVFASGSSSLEIHRHLKESLAGRKRVFHVFPCGFAEMRQAWKDDTLDLYLKYGGLPGLGGRDAQGRLALLADMVQAYLMKDIKSLIREENIRAFNHLLYLLAENQGSVVSVAGLAREIGLTQKTVESHLDIMAQTWVVFPLHSFSRNMGNELKKSRKYYFFDLGIRNMLVKDFRETAERPDGGAILESFVFSELNRWIDPVSEIRFWRTRDGREVDFVFIRNRVPVPIEVKRTLKSKELPDGLRSFLKRYPDTATALVLNLNLEGEFRFQKTRVRFCKIENTGKEIRLLSSVSFVMNSPRGEK